MDGSEYVEPFICPQCAHKSSFDPYKGSARCPRCGYSPSMGQQAGKLVARSKEPRPEHTPRTREAFRQRLLDEILGLWHGTFRPDPLFELPAFSDIEDFYADYRWALGDELYGSPGIRDLSDAAQERERRARESFVAGYFALRRGDRTGAAEQLLELAQSEPDLVDAWVWLAAVAEEQQERIHYLEEALVRDPAHLLARDAMAILQGRVSPSRRKQAIGAQATAVRCPQCAGAFEYEPGSKQVTCAHCGHILSLRETDIVNGKARLMGDLRLERRFQAHTWQQVERVLQCQSCGAELTMTRHLAKLCLFCGSPNVLNRGARPGIEQPDGFLPFSLDESSVTEALGSAVRGPLDRFRIWRSGPNLQVRELQALYLPFWVFDGFVEERTARMSLFDRNDTRAKPLVTKKLLMFENILLSGVVASPHKFLAGILPFDVDTLVPYEPRLLAEWPAALYSLDVETAVETARASMLQAAVRAAERVTEPLVRLEDNEQGNGRRGYRVTSATYQLVLLPAWAALLETRGKLRVALVNGQTGKVTLSRPLPPASPPQRVS
jgi:Zn finger protein HypA/HybF involved in hydrogenase expression